MRRETEKMRLNCADVDPEVFFRWESTHGSAKVGQAEEAFDLCFGCPARITCALGSLGAENGVLRHGIWGGTTPPERRDMVRKGVRTERQAYVLLQVYDRRTLDRRVNGTKPVRPHPTEDGEA